MKQLSIGFCLLFASSVFAVDYVMTFESTWSAETHPGAYPNFAHFTRPFTAVHVDFISLWDIDRLAGTALEEMAEIGSVVGLQEVIDDQANGGGLAGPFLVGDFMLNLPKSQSFELSLDHDFPSITFLSAIGASPDWFVGVSNLSPLSSNGTWADEMMINLFPLDAGTEEGESFSTANPPTEPPQPVSRLDTDPNSIFFDQPPIARLRLERVLVCDFNQDGICNAADLSSLDGLYSLGDLQNGAPSPGLHGRFDLTSDGIVNTDDLDQWLADAAKLNGFAEPYLKGDTNLNDHVGFGDFTTLSQNFGKGREWTEGNYRGAGVTSFADFLILAENFGEQITRASEAGTTSVPEPNIRGLFFALAIWMLWRREHLE